MPQGLPVVVPVGLKDGLLAKFRNIASSKSSFLLDSAGVAGKDSRYSFAGMNPVHTFSAAGGFISINGRTVIDNPVSALKRLFELSNSTAINDPYLPFLGGLVGFISFEWANFRGASSADTKLPDLFFGLYDTAITYDHVEGAAWVTSIGMKEDGSCDLSLAERRAEELITALDIHPADTLRHFGPLKGSHPVMTSLTKDQYIKGVNTLKRLKDLPLFAQRFSSPTHKSPWDVYLQLRENNEAPFAAFINCGDFSIMSSSRTCILKVDGDEISMKPAKGCRPRSANAEEDAKRIDELLFNQENQSSHRSMVTEIMSALGNICRPGSIEATDIASVVSDKKAHHLVTGITCRKDRNIGAIDCLLNILPACSDGKVAPLITRLENSQRGVYTGTIGFMSVNGHAEFNSAFRTMILKDTIGHLHAGTEVSVDTDAEEAFTRSGKAAERIFEKICTRPS